MEDNLGFQCTGWNLRSDNKYKFITETHKATYSP